MPRPRRRASRCRSAPSAPASVRAAGVLKGGVGTASVRLDDIGVTVGAIVAVNSAGNVADPATGLPWMADLDRRIGPQRAAGRPDRAFAVRAPKSCPR